MTIFGFNTDAKIGETVYHVQSEARQADLLLQTLVFIKGQCVGKRVVSYAQNSAQPDFSEQAMQEFLKSQHKAVLEAIQQGRIETVLGTETSIQDVGGGGLSLSWTNSMQSPDGADLSMCFQVRDAGKAVSGATVSVSAAMPANAQAVATAMTDAEGKATVNFSLTQQMMQDASVMARASHQSKSATRKFRFKK
ncbi:MAG TPA: Ig-like domain-containing protein [Candidatus Angelobacter sp.]|nr:Ig-like domain-containing protein [Candidatus Angelobacter sp.]